jgi:hypothetical protein
MEAVRVLDSSPISMPARHKWFRARPQATALSSAEGRRWPSVSKQPINASESGDHMMVGMAEISSGSVDESQVPIVGQLPSRPAFERDKLG